MKRTWKNPFGQDDPRHYLLEYQQEKRHEILVQRERFVACAEARQTGKDFLGSEIAVEDCYQRPGIGWAIAAPSERQAIFTLDQCKQWVEAWKLKIDDVLENREGSTSQTLLKSVEIKIAAPNGNNRKLSSILAVPGRPETVRGMSRNVIMTEADFFEQPLETWRALYPSITNPLSGGQKQILIYSTPFGKNNLLWKIGGESWLSMENGRARKKQGKINWLLIKTTIHDAVAKGLPVDIEELQDGMNDAEGWAQEYECEFLDSTACLLPYDVLLACENALATETVGPDYWQTKTENPRFCGIDFGRTKDLTVCWTAELIGGAFLMTKEVLCLSGMSSDKQLEVLRPRIAASTLTCFDYTGPGIGLGDFMAREFGEFDPQAHKFGKVELCTFTNAFKVEGFTKLRMRYDAKTLGVPVSIAIREDLHSVYRQTTKTGNVTYGAPHNKDGHADRAASLMLLNRAASYGATQSVGRFIPLGSTRSDTSTSRRERQANRRV
jgi:phage FluMu gp28-like protein